MNLPWPWQCLDIDQSASIAVVRRRYAELLKLNRPEDNPGGFQQLRHAYEICLAFAREQDAQGTVQAGPGLVSATTAPPAATPERLNPTTSLPPKRELSDAPADASADEPPQVALAEPTIEPLAVLPDLPPLPDEHSPWQTAEVELPAMRTPTIVVDELLAIDSATPLESAAFAHYFAECPELASFATRNDVELELLRRITAGARPTLRALQQFGAAFGWRQLGHERHLRHLGLPPEAISRINDALFRAGAEAQFEWHVSTKARLSPQVSNATSLEREIATLKRLRELRDTPPGFRALLSSSRIERVTRLFDGWTHNYGNTATLHLFGAANVAYWRSASLRASPNRLQSLASAARAAIVGAWLLAALVVIGTVAALFSTGGSFLALFEAMGILIMAGAPAIIVMSSWRLALSKATELANLAELQHEEWRRRYLARWLTPAWAIPACIALGALFGNEARTGNWLQATIPAIAISIAIFGWRSLAPLALYAAAVWGVVRVFLDELPPFAMPIAGSLTLLPIWFADWLARRRLPDESTRVRWRVIAGYSLPVVILSLVLIMVSVAIYNTTRS